MNFAVIPAKAGMTVITAAFRESRLPRRTGSPAPVRNCAQGGGRRLKPVCARRSKPQHRLGDDVALDLVGAAVDRDLAVVEVARRDLRGPVHRLVGAVVAMLVVGSCERTDYLHQKLGG